MCCSCSKRTKTFIVILLAVAMLVCVMPFKALAAEAGETVRVGAYPAFGISKSGNSYVGFAYDYLMEMQARTGHKYSFVEAEPEELLEMLAEGVIDVIPCVSAADFERWNGQYFAASARSIDAAAAPVLSESSLMKKFTAIYVSDSNADTPAYFETERLNSSTIGYLEADKGKYFVDGVYVRGDIDDAQFVSYDTESQMKADFEAGKIDAVIKDCFRPWENESIVYQYDTQDCYFLTSGEDSMLARQLDVAVNSLMMENSGLAHEIYQKHIEKYGVPKFEFSLAEKKYIQDNPVLRLAYNLQANVLEGYNSASGKIVGFTGTILKKLEQVTGIKIDVQVCATLDDCMRYLAAGDVDAVCGGVSAAGMSRYGEYYISSPYSVAPIVIAGREGVSLQGNQKIAVPYNGDDMADYIKQTYTSANMLLYNDARECMGAVQSGEADAVCASAYEIVYLINNGYEDMSILEVTSYAHNECFAMRADVAAELTTIIGKSVAQVGASESMLSHYDSLAKANELSLINSVPVQFVYVSLAVLVLIVVVALIIFVVIRARNKRESEVDALTGGRNKRKFIEDVRRMMRKSTPEKWALVLFDIDKFKFVNDRLGYEEGDRMLERIYKTLADNMEDYEICARVSDDNFACVIRNATDNEINSRLNNIYAEFDRRNSLFVKYPVIFSAGVCRLGQCYEGGKEIDVNSALDRCIIAKRTLKSAHFSSIAFYDGKIRDKVLREKDYENLMPTALEQHEFECYLQPKYGLKSRHIEGAEALIRWNSKEFGFVFPNDFIPISEKNGFVVELDFFILEEVCRAMRRWMDDGRVPVVVSVNQSRLHLNYDDYIWRLREIVDKYEIPYEYIELELTESVFMENANRLLEIMQKLHDIGFKLSLDDFGSGYSSLNMLKDIPVDVVKIDREFFNGTVNSEKGRAVISTVVDLASNLNMEVISEGVETLEQVEFLTEINCAMVQGYFFAKPMTIAQFEELWLMDIAAQEAENTQQTLEGM